MGRSLHGQNFEAHGSTADVSNREPHNDLATSEDAEKATPFLSGPSNSSIVFSGVLDVEYSICSGRILLLQQRERHIVNGDASGCPPVKRAVMSVTMQNEFGPVAINHFRQA